MLEIKIAVPTATLVWVAFEKGFVNGVLHPAEIPNYAEKIVFGKLPVDNV